MKALLLRKRAIAPSNLKINSVIRIDRVLDVASQLRSDLQMQS